MPENVQELIVKYKSDISDLKAKADQIEASLSKVGKTGEEAGKKTEKAFNAAGEAGSSLSGQFENLGKTIIAAFAVERVIAFSKESIKMYAESQKGQLQLLAALNGREDIQKRLIQQAEQLQEKFGIDNDTIVGQQAFLAVQGRTEEQIKKTISAAIALSAVTKEDLPTAVAKLDATFEGNIGKLGKLDERFKNLTPTQLANGEAIDIVNEKYTKFAEQGAQSVSTQLEIQQRRVDDLKKKFGQELAPTLLELTKVGVQTADVFFKIAGGATSIAEAIGEIAGANAFGAKFKELKDSFKSGLETKPIEELLKRSKELGEQQNKLAGASRSRALAERAAILDEIILRGKANTEVKKEIETLETLKLKLEKLKSDQGKIANPLTSGKAENDKILKEIADTQAKIDEITGEAQKKRAEAAQKDSDLAKKRLEEEAKNREALRKFTLQALQDNITDEENHDKELAAQTIHNSEVLALAVEEIELKTLEKRRDLLRSFGESTADIDKQIADKTVALAEKSNKAWEKANEDFKQSYLDWAKDLQKIDEEILKNKVQKTQDALSQIQDLEKQSMELISELAKANSEERISQLEQERDSELAAVDARQAKLDDDRKHKLIGEREYERQSEEVRKTREQKEKELNKRISEEKKKQALLERELAVFNIILNTAAAMIKVAAQTGIAAFVFSPLIAALGALQIATVLATPLPKFARGTKGAHGAMSIVGEEGPEMMFVPSGAKILSAEKTRRYSALLDAMHDNRLDDYLQKMEIGPALKHQQQLFEKKQQESFAQNIANSFLLQKEGGMNEYDLARALVKGNKHLPKEIAKELSRFINSSSYSAYH